MRDNGLSVQVGHAGRRLDANATESFSISIVIPADMAAGAPSTATFMFVDIDPSTGQTAVAQTASNNYSALNSMLTSTLLVSSMYSLSYAANNTNSTGATSPVAIIAGGVIGGIVVFLLVSAGVYLCAVSKQSSEVRVATRLKQGSPVRSPARVVPSDSAQRYMVEAHHTDQPLARQKHTGAVHV